MAAVSIQLTPRATARRIAAMEGAVVLAAPAHRPVAANRPGAEADAGNSHVGCPESPNRKRAFRGHGLSFASSLADRETPWGFIEPCCYIKLPPRSKVGRRSTLDDGPRRHCGALTRRKLKPRQERGHCTWVAMGACVGLSESNQGAMSITSTYHDGAANLGFISQRNGRTD